MGISVSCPVCQKSVAASDSSVGASVLCPQCGVDIQVVKKICKGCGADVTRRRRAKDSAGNYFCRACWEARAAEHPSVQLATAGMAGASARETGSASVVARDDAPVLTLDDLASVEAAGGEGASWCKCPACGIDVRPEEMTTDSFGEPLCTTCDQERNGPLDLAPLAIGEPALPPPLPKSVAKSVAGPSGGFGVARPRARGVKLRDFLSREDYTNYRNVRAASYYFIFFGFIFAMGGLLAMAAPLTTGERPMSQDQANVIRVMMVGMSVVGTCGLVGGLANLSGNRRRSKLVLVMAGIYLLAFPIGTILAYVMFKGLERYHDSREAFLNYNL